MDFSPSIVFRIQKADIDGLVFFLQDGKIDSEEQLKIADVILPAMTERIYRTKKLYKNGNLSAFWFLEVSIGFSLDKLLILMRV